MKRQWYLFRVEVLEINMYAALIHFRAKWTLSRTSGLPGSPSGPHTLACLQSSVLPSLMLYTGSLKESMSFCALGQVGGTYGYTYPGP